MKQYKALKDFPGHKSGDILLLAVDFYMWENEPYYSFPTDVVENYSDWFEPLVFKYIDGEPIWYISLNGLIIADNFNRQKHSSLIEFGNIFTSEKDAVQVNNQIKKILQKEDF